MVLGRIFDGIMEIIEGFLRLVGNIIGIAIVIVILIGIAMVCSCLNGGNP